MRIGVDIRSLQEDDRFRGIGSYLSNLMHAIAGIDSHNEYVCYAWSGSDPLAELSIPASFRFRLIHIGRVPGRIALSRLRNAFWRDLGVSHSDIDVFLQPNLLHGLPRGNVPTVAVVYDLIPLIFADRHPSFRLLGQIKGVSLRPVLRQIVDGWIYRWSLRQLITATRILAISHSTKQDLVRYFPHLKPKVTVTPLAHDPRFRPDDDPSTVLSRLGIRSPFLLYVGGGDFRKNIIALIDGFERLREGGWDLELVLVGRDFALGDQAHPDLSTVHHRISQSRFVQGIKRVGFVDRSDLAALYSAALALVFPSLYEGFGLPILEAMACGCPVIAYRTSSIPEVTGTAAMLLEPSADLADAVKQLVVNETMRNAQIGAGFEQAGKFSWERTAAETLSVLQETARRAS